MPRGRLLVSAGWITKGLADAHIKRQAVLRTYHRCGHDGKEYGTATVLARTNVVPHIINEELKIVALLKSCAKEKDLLKGSQIHEAIRNNNSLQRNIFVGSTLVHMYAKCGALATAQDVFDELPVRNLVTWNALMAGYVQHGQASKALDCFQQLQGEGLILDAVTFLTVFKACGSIGAIDLGLKLHEEVIKRGLLRTHSALGTSLVGMYGKFGMLKKAQEVFDNFCVRNVISWTGLISGYARHGLSKHALQYFDKMRDEGISPNSITFSCILKACGSAGALEKGENLHDEIVQKGLLKNECVLGTALVDMYAKCGALAKAKEVFEGLQKRDVIAWNALIAGYCQKGHDLEALNIFDQMKFKGYFPDAATFSCILRACGSLGQADKGKEIHDEIIEKGFLVRYSTLYLELIDMYAKCGSFKTAENLFNELPVHNVASFDSLIAGYCRHGHLKKALECVNQMQTKGLVPNASIFACILRACGREREYEMAEEVHAEILRLAPFKETGVIESALVSMYVALGSLSKAQEVLDRFKLRDLISWTTLIQGYCQRGQGEEALDGFYCLKQEGLSPDEVTFACILKTCGSIGVIWMGMEIHAEIEREGLLEKFDVLKGALVDMYAKCGAMTHAREVFDKLSVQDVVTWTALIDGYCQHGQCEEALDCFERMRGEHLTPDAVTFACILKVCGSIGAVERGNKIHDEIVRSGLLGKDTALGITLVDMYAKCGALWKAKQVFDELPVRNVVAWNVLLAGYCYQGLGAEALRCFDRMKHDGVSPDAVTFVSILNACGSTDAEKISVYFKMMKTDYGLIPNSEHYCCMVEVLGRAGQFDKALSFITKMHSHDQLQGWAAILSACRKRGNVQLGKLAFEHMLQLDEKCATAYEVMSDIYAAANMHEESKRIEDMRKKNQARL